MRACMRLSVSLCVCGGGVCVWEGGGIREGEEVGEREKRGGGKGKTQGSMPMSDVGEPSEGVSLSACCVQPKSLSGPST